jgi:hypothetical protein
VGVSRWVVSFKQCLASVYLPACMYLNAYLIAYYQKVFPSISC